MGQRHGHDFDKERAIFLLDALADSLASQSGFLHLDSADETGLVITATQLSAAGLGVQLALDALEGRSPQWSVTPFDPLPKDLIRFNFVDKPESPTTPGDKRSPAGSYSQPWSLASFCLASAPTRF